MFLGTLLAAILISSFVDPTWIVDKVEISVDTTDAGECYIDFNGKNRLVGKPIPISESVLDVGSLQKLAAKGLSPQVTEEFVYVDNATEGGEKSKLFYRLTAHRHWKYWSFLPALISIVLCWVTKEPITSLLAGILVGAALVGKANVFDEVLIPSIGTTTAATILILYLWLLGGLMGIWARTGASRAFADYMSSYFVRGPRTAKLVAWLLGVIFFQGGTISAVLVGTTVKPLADEERVSHEELSLIVDSTSSPIAVLLAFNAWPIYVQSFLMVSGVSYLATESGRVAFFFRCIPFSFYAIFSVLFTLLLSIDRLPMTPRKLKAARSRARETGQLDAPGSEPLASSDIVDVPLPASYAPHVCDFLMPLFTLIGVAVGTYLAYGSPKVLWAFAAALILASTIAWGKGMNLQEIVLAIVHGQKSLVLGSVILLLAITLGDLSQEVGGGRYLVALLGDLQWYWVLPAASFLIAVVIAFSTGTSWATFAITLPLVMQLSHAISVNHCLSHPELFVSICFAACLNGGVFGDQCSPISDTTILSAMCTGSDLMDHVTTQIPVATMAAGLALLCWTTIAVLIV